MPAAVQLTVEGYEGIDKSLAHLPLAVREAVLKNGLRNAAKKVASRAKELCPPPGYPGDKPEFKPLRDTIGYVIRPYTRNLVAVIGPQYPAGAHGHLVEDGTKPHHIVATSKKRGLADVRRGLFFGTTVLHPGAKPFPFLAPAAEDTRAAQQQAITDAIASEIVKHIVPGRK